MALALDTPALPCPACRMRGLGGYARIGNKRAKCAMCNRFVQQVMRVTRARLIEEYPDEYASLRMKVELDLYPRVLEEFLRRYPAARGPQEETSAD